MPIENNSAGDLQLLVPNLHRRYSGVTATNRMVAPKLAKMFCAAWLGPDAPDGIARIGVADLPRWWRRRTPLIWHARRNNEMIIGVLLRSLGWPLKLLFTSAAQRHHSWITRWLIRRMDAIIATSDISASYLKRTATVIPHGVDTDRYAPPENRAAAFETGGGPKLFGVVIRFKRWHAFGQGDPRQLRANVNVHVRRQRRRIVERADANEAQLVGATIVTPDRRLAGRTAMDDVRPAAVGRYTDRFGAAGQ